MRLLAIAALLFVATPLSPQTPQTMDGALPAGFYFVFSHSKKMFYSRPRLYTSNLLMVTYFTFGTPICHRPTSLPPPRSHYRGCWRRPRSLMHPPVGGTVPLVAPMRAISTR